MTEDPGLWQDALVEIAVRLEAKTRQSRWTARTDHLIERDFALGAYAIRKLVESRHVPDDISGRSFPVRRCGATGPDEFDGGRRATLSVRELCHAILHSVVFTFSCGETADLFDGVYVAPARHRNRFAYLVLASDFIGLCSDIAES
ncbi:hypothetical protein [Mycobacterium sp. 1274761.0]|uniref:hypothetical protein n=1 Tax=Mycobacterium sp. 1274761.0 TaxID=1834077 RepID=UPI0007FC4853|nr:hypothetical protein [Mycobacterium sp. 1274761.0]OBK72748.1 hypothetical protein A5651_15380 [Mycobacterium sp. 1274761.0]